MNPLAFHMQDYLQDLFLPGPTDEPVTKKATGSEPIIVDAAFEPSLTYDPRTSKPTPSELRHNALKASEPEPMRA